MLRMLPPAELLGRARLLAGPAVGPSVAGALERITGRPVERVPAGRAPVERAYGPAPDGPDAPDGLDTPDEPFLYVGDALPDALRTGRLVWFHSINAGTDALLGSGVWPEGALLTRTVGRMGERIAQYVLGWLLADCQSVPEHLAQHERAEWRRIPSELAAGRTALVYGTGRIGSAVGGLLGRCGIRTVGVGRTGGVSRPGPPGFDRVTGAGSGEETDALHAARWVVSTLPLTDGTEKFFGDARFSALRGASFINTGRGATVDMAALEAALHRGTVRRAVLDVLPDEPAGPDAPAWRLPRTVITSHSAGITADEDVVTDFAACWDAVSEGRLPPLAVDVVRGY